MVDPSPTPIRPAPPAVTPTPPVTRSDILRWLASQPWYVWVVLAAIFCGVIYFLFQLGVLDELFRFVTGVPA